jgi:predicted small lipoprotein YifL
MYVLRSPLAAALPALLLSSLAGCWGRNIDYEGGVAEDTAPVEQVVCGDESTYGTGFRIEGTAVDFATGITWDAVAQPMCVTAIDPTPAITGGEPGILASSTLCEDGSFVVSGITEAPAIGAALKETLAACGLKMPQLAMPVRVLVMGTAQTPSLDAVLALLPQEKVLSRLQSA